MSDTSVIDYGKSKIKATKFIGEMDGTVAAGSIDNAAVASDAAIDASKVAVAATGEVTADDLQAVIAALDVRVKALEDAAV